MTEENQKYFPFVSVIIPVYNDSKRLEHCLSALEDQTYPSDLYEIIVIDNNSEENIASVVNCFKLVKLVYEAQRGSYAARNTGIKFSKGQILAFTDSDCIPANNWIDKGVKAFLSVENCGLVAGRIELFFRNPQSPTGAELYDSLNCLNQQHYLEVKRYGATANMFTSKEIFEKVGLFNAQLQSGGDKEWGNRVFQVGYQQIYSEEAYILHPARLTIKQLRKKIVRTVEGHFWLRNDAQRPLIDFLGELYWDFKPPFRELLDIFRSREFKSLNQKLSYAYIMLSLRTAKAQTKAKLYFNNKLV